jgi:hypothetical protein
MGSASLASFGSTLKMTLRFPARAMSARMSRSCLALSPSLSKV